MREVAIAVSCSGAEKVLYHRFRGEPFLAEALKGSRQLYEFFKGLVELARQGYPRLICAKLGTEVAAAAVYTVPERLRARQLVELLKLLLRTAGLRVLFRSLRSARSFWAYAKALRGLEPSGHLLFIASAIEGMGYGSLLLKLVERACARAGCKWIVLEVHVGNPAVRFYLKRGYRPRGSVEWLGARYLLMAKPLHS
ncbi:MAG: GNAT family N-acetyltransferase [Thermofilaceae archaeon]